MRYGRGRERGHGGGAAGEDGRGVGSQGDGLRHEDGVARRRERGEIGLQDTVGGDERGGAAVGLRGGHARAGEEEHEGLELHSFVVVSSLTLECLVARWWSGLVELGGRGEVFVICSGVTRGMVSSMRIGRGIVEGGLLVMHWMLTVLLRNAAVRGKLLKT